MKIKATKVHSLLQNHYNRIPLSAKSTEQILHLIGDPNSNPNKAIVTKLRLTPWADKSDLDKQRLCCFTPNAWFPKYVKEGNACTPSGLVYIDLDSKAGFSYEREMECLRKNPHVVAAWPSIRGIGIGSFHRVDWTTPYNFKEAFALVVDVMAQYGSAVQYVDWKCCNIAWLNYLSFTDRMFTNLNAASLSMPEGIIGPATVGGLNSRANDTFTPYEDHVIERIDYETQITDWQADEIVRFIPEGQDYHRLYVGSESYSKGERNSMLFKIGCKMKVLNPGLGTKELGAHLWSVNLRMCATPLTPKEVNSVAESVLKTAKEKGVYAPSRKRKVWFRKDGGLTPKEKLSISAALIANQRKEKTTAMLQKAVAELKEKGDKVTQKNVAAQSGKSLATVKRYWNVIMAL